MALEETRASAVTRASKEPRASPAGPASTITITAGASCSSSRGSSIGGPPTRMRGRHRATGTIARAPAPTIPTSSTAPSRGFRCLPARSDRESDGTAGYGIDTQRQAVNVKTHASSGAQNPSHDGESALPHGVVRHSHAPPEATAEQWPPFPQVPSHFRSLPLNSHGAEGRVVVDPIVTGV